EQEVAYRKIATGELLSFNKLRAFIDGIIARRNQESIFALTAINEAERHTINDLESVLRSVERFITSIDKEREAHLKKVAFHSSVTPETLDLVIQKLMKLRKLIHAGYGIKSAAEAA
ncbi:MAG TPA: hypothetical protein VMT62_11725, partial [Syntrophorhabdaceae bacterium]|nr:hypothetical protein [Syntrophorhabdaceae bacterium]